MSTVSKVLVLRATLRGHDAMVTSIAIPSSEDSNVIMSSSRDKTLILWHLSKDVNSYGVLLRRLRGHSHFVSDVALSSDASFAVSASWDGELRLWDLTTLDTPTRRFVGHTKDILSVAIFGDRAIVSGSRDRTLKLWNTRGECVGSTAEIDGHRDWVSCVRFFPETEDKTVATLVSGSWDGTLMVWELDKVLGLRKRFTLAGHEGYLNALAISPDGSLLASGGKDGVVFLWDMADGRKVCEIETGFIHALSYCPEHYLLCVATDESIKVWDLVSKETIQELKVTLNTHDNNSHDNNNHVNGGTGITTNNNHQNICCTSLNWSADGTTLFSGYADGVIRVWELICEDSQ